MGAFAVVGATAAGVTGADVERRVAMARIGIRGRRKRAHPVRRGLVPRRRPAAGEPRSSRGWPSPGHEPAWIPSAVTAYLGRRWSTPDPRYTRSARMRGSRSPKRPPSPLQHHRRDDPLTADAQRAHIGTTDLRQKRSSAFTSRIDSVNAAPIRESRPEVGSSSSSSPAVEAALPQGDLLPVAVGVGAALLVGSSRSARASVACVRGPAAQTAGLPPRHGKGGPGRGCHAPTMASRSEPFD